MIGHRGAVDLMPPESTKASADAAIELSSDLDLSIIIVSWNVRDLLRVCLQSIADNEGALRQEVIVVDGGSTDGSHQMVQDEFPAVRLIAKNVNVGFPKGNNIGIGLANGRNLLLLNPDTVVLGEAIEQMSFFLDGNQEVGAVGPQLLNSDRSVQSSRRRFPSLWLASFESTWLQSLAPRRVLARYYMEDVHWSQMTDVDWLVGACLMVPRRVFDAVGPLDEAYFMYSEELDLCRRIKDAGWRITYLPEARVVHHMGKSSEQVFAERHINFQRAKLRYFRKYHGVGAALLLRTIILANFAVQMALESVKGCLGHKRPLRWQRAKAYWQVLRSGLKPAGY